MTSLDPALAARVERAEAARGAAIVVSAAMIESGSARNLERSGFVPVHERVLRIRPADGGSVR